MDTNTKILIVENELPLAKSLEYKLAKAGFAVKPVADGVAAMEELMKEKYGLILLDIIMPNMDGWKVLKAVSELKLDIKVVVVSNLNQPEDIQKAKDLGAVEFLVKTQTSLSDIVKYIINL